SGGAARPHRRSFVQVEATKSRRLPGGRHVLHPALCSYGAELPVGEVELLDGGRFVARRPGQFTQPEVDLGLVAQEAGALGQLERLTELAPDEVRIRRVLGEPHLSQGCPGMDLGDGVASLLAEAES